MYHLWCPRFATFLAPFELCCFNVQILSQTLGRAEFWTQEAGKPVLLVQGFCPTRLTNRLSPRTLAPQPGSTWLDWKPKLQRGARAAFCWELKLWPTLPGPVCPLMTPIGLYGNVPVRPFMTMTCAWNQRSQSLCLTVTQRTDEARRRAALYVGSPEKIMSAASQKRLGRSGGSGRSGGLGRGAETLEPAWRRLYGFIYFAES